jgi:hypothetical protein
MPGHNLRPQWLVVKLSLRVRRSRWVGPLSADGLDGDSAARFLRTPVFAIVKRNCPREAAMAAAATILAP